MPTFFGGSAAGVEVLHKDRLHAYTTGHKKPLKKRSVEQVCAM